MLAIHVAPGGPYNSLGVNCQGYSNDLFLIDELLNGDIVLFIQSHE